MSLKRIHAKSSSFGFGKITSWWLGEHLRHASLNIIKVFVANDIHFNCLLVSHSLIHSKTWDELTIIHSAEAVFLYVLLEDQLPVFWDRVLIVIPDGFASSSALWIIVTKSSFSHGSASGSCSRLLPEFSECRSACAYNFASFLMFTG